MRCKFTIGDAQCIALERGGKCLSKKYVNIHDKLEWQCKCKFKWKASFNSVKQGSWCPKCGIKNRANKRKLKNGLGLAKNIAEAKSGKCLSCEYINNRTLILWECYNKHRWHASLSNIQKGRWCPSCAQLQRVKSLTNSYILHHWKTNEELICQASWEGKVVEYLNKNKINFRWQSRVFIMPDRRSYRPDLYLFTTKKWIEIKGRFWGDAEEKWNWFHLEKPNSELWNENKLKEMGIL